LRALLGFGGILLGLAGVLLGLAGVLLGRAGVLLGRGVTVATARRCTILCGKCRQTVIENELERAASPIAHTNQDVPLCFAEWVQPEE